jgi:hypothetical protein
MGKTSRTLRSTTRLPVKPVAAAPVSKRSKPPEVAEDSALEIEALVDGKRVVIEALDEIVLRCGQASITLRRNGRIVIRGTYIETRAIGTNRIKGGNVQIN